VAWALEVGRALGVDLVVSAAVRAPWHPGRCARLALPDGTVVVDTGKTDDPTNTLPQGNSYQHFLDKTVNENHNSRVAIMSAQQYPCGLGVESKLSSSTGFVESYVAIRLGAQLDSNGTARLSTH